MSLRTPAEELIARTLANALRGHFSLGPVEVMRLAAAARIVDPRRIAALALEQWIATDVRAEEILRSIGSRS